MKRSGVEQFYLWGPLVLAALAYMPSLGGDFVYDDVSITVLADPYLQGQIGWQEALQRDRPLRSFTYALDHFVWSFGADGPGMPFGYHLQNLFWHLLNVYLVCRLGRRVGCGGGQSAIAAAFFAVHPMGTEAVAWISGRKDLLCLAFQLLSLLALLDCVREGQLKRRVVAFGIVSNFFLVAALLSKQVAVMTPFLAVPILWLSQRNSRPLVKKRATALLAVQIAVVGIVGFLQLRGLDAFQSAGASTFRDPGAEAYERTWLSALLTGSFVWGQVHRLLLLPWDPTLDRVIVPVMELADLRWLWGVVWTLGALGFARWCRSRSILPVAGYAWIALAWIPTSGLSPIAYLLADRYLYVPLVGFGLIVAGLWDTLMQRLPSQRVRVGFALAFWFALVLMTSWSAMRCFVWRNDITLMERTIQQVGATPRLLYGLGTAYDRAGEPQWAMSVWEECLELDPDYHEARLNLAVAHKHAGDIDGAEAIYRECLKRNASYGTAHYNLAVLLEQRGRVPEALEHFRAAAQTVQGKADTDFRRAKAFVQVARLRLGEPDRSPKALAEAARCLSEALRMSPRSAEAWDYEGRRWILSGDPERARQAWERSFALDDGRAEVALNLGIAALQRGDRAAAERYFQRAASLNPEYAGTVQTMLGIAPSSGP